MNSKKTQVFTTLFENDVRGKTKSWKISVIDNTDHSIIETEYGYISGKMTKSSKRIDVGKNIGKRNETTHFQQAVLEATSKWEKKKETGFSENLRDTNQGDTNQGDTKQCDTNQGDTKQGDTNQGDTKQGDTNQGDTKQCDTNQGVINVSNENNSKQRIIFPMLASDFKKFKHKTSYPVYVQPKLDGYRMIYDSQYKTCNSRQGKSFDAIKTTPLYKELCEIKESGLVLDGELYKHGGVFEHLGILRKKKLTDTDKQTLETIEYHVYDIVDHLKSYNQRLETLQNLFKNNEFLHIRLVETIQAESEEQINYYHSNFVQRGYEGSMIRIASSKYRTKARSQELLKLKDFIDSEYKIIDFTYEQDVSNNQPLIVWICVTENGLHFNVRPKGTREERNELFKRGKDFVGQWLHVKYFELTESKIPRFPTTKTETFTSYIRNTIE